jgi:hypothetical protein
MVDPVGTQPTSYTGFIEENQKVVKWRTSHSAGWLAFDFHEAFTRLLTPSRNHHSFVSQRPVDQSCDRHLPVQRSVGQSGRVRYAQLPGIF